MKFIPTSRCYLLYSCPKCFFSIPHSALIRLYLWRAEEVASRALEEQKGVISPCKSLPKWCECIGELYLIFSLCIDVLRGQKRGRPCFVHAFNSTCCRFICETSRPLAHMLTKASLHKLLSSFILKQLYLFIICSQAVLWLSQGFVRRGNLSLPAAPLAPAFPAGQCSLLCFCIVLLSRDKQTRVVYCELRCILCSHPI